MSWCLIRRFNFHRRSFAKDTAGSVSVEVALMSTLMALLTLGAIEGSFIFWQWNATQQAAREGARIAAVSDPVDQTLSAFTGLQTGVVPGDPMPSYRRVCAGDTRQCSNGVFDQDAFNRILSGSRAKSECNTQAGTQKGMCAAVNTLKAAQVEVEYINSGLGIAGYPSGPRPLITVTVRDVEFDFAILNLVMPNSVVKLPAVKATALAEDLKGTQT
jgi:Flp pilus assembly protein TadG